MPEYPKIPFDLSVIAEAFQLVSNNDCIHLAKWTSAKYELTDFEQQLLERTHTDIKSDGDYLNEEEIKIRLIAPLFQIANIDETPPLRVFYERPLSAVVNHYSLSVICDCMVATTTLFRTPVRPYFFLQEFKKAKPPFIPPIWGDKGGQDPEAQMLVAMLAAQARNNDGKPIYGGFLIGSHWRLTTLVDNEYCLSRPFLAFQKEDLLQLACSLRYLKTLHA